MAKNYPTAPGPYIYGLVDPRTGVLRYVGKCHGRLRERLRSHVSEARNSNNHNHRLAWIRSVLADGEYPDIICLQSVSEEVEATIERGWIAFLRFVGWPLVNQTMGGEGMPGPSEELRAKLRKRPQVQTLKDYTQVRRERAAQPEHKERQRLKRNADARVARRAIPKMRGAELQEFRKQNAIRMGKLNTGKPKSSETRQKLSESLKKAYQEGRAMRPQDRARGKDPA